MCAFAVFAMILKGVGSGSSAAHLIQSATRCSYPPQVWVDTNGMVGNDGMLSKLPLG
jgi:hypothetical protein